MDGLVGIREASRIVLRLRPLPTPPFFIHLCCGRIGSMRLRDDPLATPARSKAKKKTTAVNKFSRKRVGRNGRSSRHGEVATPNKTWRAEAAMAKMRTPRAEPRFAREVRLGSPRGCSFSHHCMNKRNYIISSAKRGRGTLQRRAGMNHPDNDKKEKKLKCHGTVAVYR